MELSVLPRRLDPGRGDLRDPTQGPSCTGPCFRTSTCKMGSWGVWRFNSIVFMPFYAIFPFLYTYTGSTAQGGGRSFKNRKTYRRGWLLWIRDGRAKPLMDRKVLEVSSLSLSFGLTIYLPTYLPIYLSIYLSIIQSIYLSIYLSIYRSIYRSIYLSICLSVCLSTYLSIYLSDLSMYLSM